MNKKILFAFDPKDTAEIRLEKFAIFLVAGGCTIAGCLWGIMYYIIFGIGLTSILPLIFSILVGGALFISHVSKNHHFAIYSQIICIIYVTTFIQWSIGGVFDSGIVMVWGFCGPITALMFLSVRKSTCWLALYLLNLLLTVIFNEFFVSHGTVVPENIRIFFFIMNLSFPIIVIFVFASYFVSNAVNERERANKLLLSILPHQIAEELKRDGEVQPKRHEDVAVLIADIVGFTPYCESHRPEEVIADLQAISDHFETIIEINELEKINAVGDSFMAVAGLNPSPNNSVLQSVKCGLEIHRALENLPSGLKLRIGVHAGPVVAGVVGQKKFLYGLFGDTVNTAARMQSNGRPGIVCLSADAWEKVKDNFQGESQGTIDVKGKGPMEIFFASGINQ